MAEVTLSVSGESVEEVLSVFREYAENLLAQEVENAPLEDEPQAVLGQVGEHLPIVDDED